MNELSVAVLGTAAVTPLGISVEQNCDALFLGRTAFREARHFDARGRKLGIDPELDEGCGSRAVRLLEKLRSALKFAIPVGTRFFLSTTVGAVDLLERGENGDTAALLLNAAERIFGLQNGILVSAACASGQTAVALAARQLAAGYCRHALVVGCDVTSEFVTTGFAALGAVSPGVCRPYDAHRDGLTLGESAAALLLGTSGEAMGRILGAAESCDAAHITAPDLDGVQLRRAIRSALGERHPGGVIGHGTGTVYNDLAEVSALNAVFPETPPPLFSLKGNLGHTLGATGVLQLALGIELSKRRLLPPQAGLETPMAGANVSTATGRLASPLLVSLNVGFGGLNSAVVMEAL